MLLPVFSPARLQQRQKGLTCLGVIRSLERIQAAQCLTAVIRAYLAAPRKGQSPPGCATQGWSWCQEQPQKRRWVQGAAGEVVPGRIEPIRWHARISGDYAL